MCKGRASALHLNRVLQNCKPALRLQQFHKERKIWRRVIHSVMQVPVFIWRAESHSPLWVTALWERGHAMPSSEKKNFKSSSEMGWVGLQLNVQNDSEVSRYSITACQVTPRAQSKTPSAWAPLSLRDWNAETHVQIICSYSRRVRKTAGLLGAATGYSDGCISWSLRYLEKYISCVIRKYIQIRIKAGFAPLLQPFPSQNPPCCYRIHSRTIYTKIQWKTLCRIAG